VLTQRDVHQSKPNLGAYIKRYVRLLFWVFTYLSPFRNESYGNASGGQKPRLLSHFDSLSVILDLIESRILKLYSLRDLTTHQSAKFQDNREMLAE